MVWLADISYIPTDEVKRRTNVVGTVPNEDAIARLIGAILLAHNDEWAVQRAPTT